MALEYSSAFLPPNQDHLPGLFFLAIRSLLLRLKEAAMFFFRCTGSRHQEGGWRWRGGGSHQVALLPTTVPPPSRVAAATAAIDHRGPDSIRPRCPNIVPTIYCICPVTTLVTLTLTGLSGFINGDRVNPKCRKRTLLRKLSSIWRFFHFFDWNWNLVDIGPIAQCINASFPSFR